MNAWMKDRRIQVVVALLLGLLLGWAVTGRGGQEHAHNASLDADIVAAESVWTCSMHPQIRENRPGKCPICGMDLVPVSARRTSGGTFDPSTYRMSPEAAALAQVRTARVERAPSVRTVELNGRVTADERTARAITAEFSGRVERLYADFTGQTVRAGEPLLSLHSPELLAAQRELLEAARLRETHPALHAAARERLRQWGISAAQLDAVERSGEPLPTLDVTTRTAGTVLERMVSVGDYVGRGDALLTLADLGRVWVVFDAYEGDLAWLSRGDSLTFTVSALPGRTFRSVVAFVDPVVGARARAARVRVEVDNPRGQLKPEMFARAIVRGRAPAASGAGAAAENMVRVPASAVLWTGPRSVVYVQVPGEEDPVFVLREVTLGPRAGDDWLIAEGLEAGEQVVVHGAFAVDAAAQLAGSNSMMARPSAASMSERVELPEAFRSAFARVVEHYIDWKNALVASDAGAARGHAESLHRAVDAVDVSVLSGRALEVWRAQGRSFHQTVARAATTGDLKESRTHFQPASDALIMLVETFGSPRGKLNVDWCPMADDDRGAYWLSKDEEILNPYFGDRMLRCGETRRVIPEAGASGRTAPSGLGHEGHVH